MKLIGLSGGIACGKSTVSRLLVQAGIPVLDADLIAHHVTRKGHWGYRRVVSAFGPRVLRADGEIDREVLAALVFSDVAARRRLNAATHPAVGLELARRILCAWLRCKPAIVVDMPLLFETGFYRLTRPHVLVVCSPELQQQRLVARDALSAAAADARIAAQMPLAAKLRLADVMLHNDGDGLEQLRVQVEQLARQLRRHAWLHRYLLSPVGLLAASAAAAAWYRLQLGN